MGLTNEQLHIAAQIDARMRELEHAGSNEIIILAEMHSLMPGFKRLLDTAGQLGMDELCRRFDAFYRYAKLLEKLAAGIQSGEIKVP